MEKVKELQAQVFRSTSMETQTINGTATPAASNSNTKPLTPKQREAAMTQLRAEMEKLSEEQREQVRQSMGDGFRERMRATIKAYRALPKEKRAAFLDEQIDEMEERRAEFQRGDRGGERSTSGLPRPGSGERGPPSNERRLQRRREMLAETTPEERAEAEMYFSDLNARREARGLEAFGPGRR